MNNLQPLCRCENPKRIINPYTKESLVVPCGHCRACALNRANRLSLQCSLEAQSNKYCLFVTLTYANRFIPRAQFVDRTDKIYGCDLIDPSTSEVLYDDVPLNPEKRQQLLDKFYLFGAVPYLRKSDLQKFLKRFRYYVSKYTKEKVRYFACGEYGPVHFRPHFHILLFFNSETLLQISSDLISQSWPFGRVDSQITQGQATNYVSGYVNSSVSVPEIFKVRATAPFCLHSQRLGQGFLQGERKKVYEKTPQEFIHRSMLIGDKFKEFDLWRSCYAYFFPKCKGFATLPARECIDIYRCYYYARTAFPDVNSVLDLARSIAQTNHLFSTYTCCEYCNVKEIWLFRYFADGSDSAPDSDEFNKYIYRIYVELLISKHFLTYVCDTSSAFPTYYEIERKYKLIVEFYKELDYLHLTDFFENQSNFYESDLIGDEDLMSDGWQSSIYPYFYDNVRFSWKDYKCTALVQLYNSEVHSLFYDRIKHKVLNDQNKIFLSD